jgi:hypothetical protein
VNWKNFKIINLENKDEWKSIVKNNFHFSGQTWDYNKLQEISSKLETYLLHFKDNKKEYFFPFHKKKYKNFEYIFSPKGYTGFNQLIDEKLYTKLLSYLRHKGFITAFIKLNPFIFNKNDQLFLKAIKKNISYFIDLSNDLEKIRQNYKKSLVRSIKKAHDKNFRIRQYNDNDYLEVKKIYIECLKNFKINNDDNISLNEINFLFNEYESKECFVATKNNEIFAVIFFLIGSNTCDYYITVSKKNYNFLSSFLIDCSYEHLIKKGIYKINLGGSVINKPGIEQYKKSFRSNQSPSKYLEIILNQDMYDFNCIDGTTFPTFKENE